MWLFKDRSKGISWGRDAVSGMNLWHWRHDRESDLIRLSIFPDNEKLYEEYFQLTDITTQFQGVFKKFYGSEDLRTCKNCGAVMEPPPIVS